MAKLQSFHFFLTYPKINMRNLGYFTLWPAPPTLAQSPALSHDLNNLLKWQF